LAIGVEQGAQELSIIAEALARMDASGLKNESGNRDYPGDMAFVRHVVCAGVLRGRGRLYTAP